MAQRADIRKIEKEGGRIKKQQERLTAKGLELLEATKAHSMAMEDLVVAQLREAGLMRLPLAHLLEAIKLLGRRTETENQTEWRQGGEESVEPKPADSVRDPVVDRDLIEVTVKITSNASEKNRSLLEDCRLIWNGKLGLWKGHVDVTSIAILREHFGDHRVKVKPQRLTTDEGGLEPYPKPSPFNPSSEPGEALPEPSPPTTDAVERLTGAEPTAGPDIAKDEEDPAGGRAETMVPPTTVFRHPPIGLPRRPPSNQ